MSGALGTSLKVPPLVFGGARPTHRAGFKRRAIDETPTCESMTLCDVLFRTRRTGCPSRRGSESPRASKAVAAAGGACAKEHK